MRRKLTDEKRREERNAYMREYRQRASVKARLKERLKTDSDFAERWKKSHRESSKKYYAKLNQEQRKKRYAGRKPEARTIEKVREYWENYKKKIGIEEFRRRNREKARRYRIEKPWWDSKEKKKVRRERIKARCMVDSDYYAKKRAKDRVRDARIAIKKRGKYKPNYSRRIPDWCVMGEEILDTKSLWLEVNMTDAQRDYGREKKHEELCSHAI